MLHHLLETLQMFYNALCLGNLGAPFMVRIAILQKSFEIYVNDHIYGSFEFVTTSSKCLQYAEVQGDFARITQFHHRLLFPLVFPKTLICSEKIAFQSDAARKYETGMYRIFFSILIFVKYK